MEIVLLLSFPPSSSSSSPLFFIDKESGRLPRFPLSFEHFSLSPLPPKEKEEKEEKEKQEKEIEFSQTKYKLTISDAISHYCLSRGLSIFPFPPPSGAHPFGPPVDLEEGGERERVQGKEKGRGFMKML